MDLFAIFQSPLRRKCDEFNLVLQAVNLNSQVTDYEGKYYLLVDEQNADTAYRQLKLYIRENAPEEHIAQPLLPLKKGFGGAYLYAIILLVIGVLQNSEAFSIQWQQIGLADSLKIFYGEWWRNITALTLHADIGHLAGNIGFGILFGLLVSQHIGSAGAWLTILVSGAIGNAANAHFHSSLHQSLGASTMVFSALGMLGVFALNSKTPFRKRNFRHWLPFLSTAALLAFVGTGGERTDVLAHLSGYLTGCVGGLIWLAFGKPQITALKPRLLLAFASVSIICVAWSLALLN